MAKSLATNFRLSNFNTALVADHTTMLHAFVLAAEALPVSHRTKDASAEETIALGLEGAVVDRFGFGHLTMRPLPDLFR